MLVGRDLRPGCSDTPESHSPAVATGLYADCVFRERSESAIGRDKSGGDMRGAGQAVAAGTTMGAGMTTTAGRVVGSIDGTSEEERSETESVSSLMRMSSTLRLAWRFSSLSNGV